MSRTSGTRRRNVCPRLLGLVVTIGGCGFLLLYPLAVPVVYPLVPDTLLPGSNVTIVGPIHPLLVYCSTIVGPLLCTWGVFAVRHRTIAPLTSRRALLAPLLSLLSIGAGAGMSTYAWAREQPIRWCTTEPTTTFSVPEILQIEVTGLQFVALAATSAVVVGVMAACRGRQRTLASAIVPVALIVLGIVWEPRLPALATLVVDTGHVLVLGIVGYVGAQST